MQSKNIRLRVLKSTVALGALMAFGVLGASYGDGAKGETSSDIETIVVTGTHIPRAQSQQPNEVQEVTADDMAHSGTTNVTDYLATLPSLTGSITQVRSSAIQGLSGSDGYSVTGLNLLNLRGLGYNNTLVLVDGHRHVGGSSGLTAVDINTIPTSLIDHVEMATGASAAIYGSDAAAGAVNFIMKHDLEGMHASIQGGLPQDGGGNTLQASASYGINTSDGKGNLTFTVEHFQQGRISQFQRDFSNKDYEVPYMNANGIYSLQKGVEEFAFSKNGAYVDANAHLTALTGNYNGDGSTYTRGTTYDYGSSKGGDDISIANGDLGDLVPKVQRTIGEISGKYEASPYFKLTSEIKFARVHTSSYSSIPYHSQFIYSDNPFLNSTVSNAILNNSTSKSAKSNATYAYNNAQIWYGFAQSDLAIANGYAVGSSRHNTWMSYYNSDMTFYNYYISNYNYYSNYKRYYGVLYDAMTNLRKEEGTTRNTYRGVIDASGDLPDLGVVSNLHYDVSYVFGQTDVDDVQYRNIITSRLTDALDAVADSNGAAVCRSGDSGCVAYNPFAPASAQSQKSIAWFARDTHNHGHLTQHVGSALVTGAVPQTADFLAGPLQFAVGMEYRYEESVTRNDPYAQSCTSSNLCTPAPDDESGSFSAAEGFAEASLPILKDKPFAKELTLDGSIRQSSYNNAGDTTTWKFGGTWAPWNWLHLRGTDAFTVRPPNIGEMYGSSRTNTTYISDPCNGTNATKSATRKKNCQALLDALNPTYLGGYTAGKTTLDTFQVTDDIQGNKNLKPEASRTVSAGFTIQPENIPNLVFSADWYRVKITNVIGFYSAYYAAEQCVDSATINNAYCDAVTRSSTSGAITTVTLTEANLTYRKTSGIDFSALYHVDPQQWIGSDIGTFDFRLNGNYLDTLKRSDLPEYKPGIMYNPKWHLNFDTTWVYGKWDVDYNIDWFSRTTPTSDVLNSVYGIKYKFDAKFENNIQIGYVLGDAYRAYFGVKNLTDQKPSNITPIYPIDPQGRTFYFGITANADALSKLANVF